MKKIKTCLFNRDCLEDGAAVLPLDGTGLVMAFTLPGRDFPELASREDMEKSWEALLMTLPSGSS